MKILSRAFFLFKRLNLHLFQVSLILLLVSCNQIFEITNGNHFEQNKGLFRGYVPSLDVSKSFNLMASDKMTNTACLDSVRAILLKVSDYHKDENKIIYESSVNNDGTFEIRYSGLTNGPSLMTDYYVNIIGCDALVSGPVLTMDEVQVFDSKSSFIVSTLDSNVLNKLSDISRDKIFHFYKLLKGDSFQEVVSHLKNDHESGTYFEEIFETSLNGFNLSPFVGVSYPKQVEEGKEFSLRPIVLNHEDSQSAFYEWIFDGQVISRVEQLNYTFNKNSQGQKKISLRVGYSSNGANEIDESRPYSSKVISLDVINSYPPVAPIVINNQDYVSELNYQFNFSKDHCDTFSYFEVRGTTLNDDRFSCNNDEILIALEDREGEHQISIYAFDEAGNTSPPSSFILKVDRRGPVLSFFHPVVDIGGKFQGGSEIDLNWQSVDEVNMGQTFDILISSDEGMSWSTVISNLNIPSYRLVFPRLNSDVSKLKIIARDHLGNSSELITHSFSIDSLPPSNSSFYLASNLINTSNVILHHSGCSEENLEVLISETMSALNEVNSIWSPCRSLYELTLQNLDEGDRILFIWMRDDVGNISNVTELSFKLDLTPPLITQDLFNSFINNLDVIQLGGACETDSLIHVTGHINQSVQCLDSRWSVSATSTYDGVFQFQIWSSDIFNNNSSKVNVTWTRDTELPVLSNVLIADGSEYVGTNYVMVSVDVDDNVGIESLAFINAHTVTKSCLSEFNSNSWIPYNEDLNRYSTQLSPGDGEKKICVWAKDRAGNISEMTSFGSSGVNFDTVLYEVGNPPEIISFNVGADPNDINFDLGEVMALTWDVSDVEGLATSPVSIWYTTDSSSLAEWIPIIENYGDIPFGSKTYQGFYNNFVTPSAGYLRLKMMVKDSAGNTSLTSEKTLNTGNWSIFAGSIDPGIGGSAKGVVLSLGSDRGLNYAAIDPLTNDAYAVNSSVGIIKLNAVTGLTELFIKSGTNSLKDNTFLNDSMSVNAALSKIFFDHSGLMYITTASTILLPMEVWQIDLKTKLVSKYLGGGDLFEGDLNFSNVKVQYGPMTFDEENSLYFLTYCGEGNYSINTSANPGLKLMKAFQDKTSKKVKSISTIAGNCKVGNPTSNTTAVNPLDAPLNNPAPIYIGGIAAWDGGRKIFYCLSSACFKIIDNKTYRSSILSPSGVYYDSNSQSLILSHSKTLKRVVLNLDGGLNDELETYVSNNSAGDCFADGVHRLDSCSSTSYSAFKGPSGKVAFLEGANNAASGNYSIRYIDDEDRVRTYLGSPPFFGDGKHRSLIRSDIAGIYLKGPSEPNQDAFPSGIYFTDMSAKVFGRISYDDKVEIIAGNQSLYWNKDEVNDGDIFDKQLSLGTSEWSYNNQALFFNKEGLPVMKISDKENGFIVVNSDKTVNYLGTGSTKFETAQTGNNPYNFALNFRVTGNNITAKGLNKFFFLGGEVSSNHPNNKSSTLMLFDYDESAPMVTRIMGDPFIDSIFSPDDTSGLGVIDKQFSTQHCSNELMCYIYYDDDSDRLYFSETTRLRFISNPENPEISTLETLTSHSRQIRNYIFSKDKNKLFYISNDGHLYCRTLNNTVSLWCNETSLGPSAGLPIITKGPNQFTWLNETKLLISNYKGFIYQLDLPVD